MHSHSTFTASTTSQLNHLREKLFGGNIFSVRLDRSLQRIDERFSLRTFIFSTDKVKYTLLLGGEGGIKRETRSLGIS